MIEWLHPGLVYLFGAALIPFFSHKRFSIAVRNGYLIAVTLTALLAVAHMHPGSYGAVTLSGREMVLGRVDKTSILFGWVFTIMGLIGTVYGLHVKKPGQHIAAFLYVGSSLGVVFAADFFGLYLFWEMMAFSSAYLIFARGGKAAIQAGFRYLLVHVSGGVVLLAGIVLYTTTTGSSEFVSLTHDTGIGSRLILAGFILNAAVPPLNAWLTDAYPEATVTGAVFLCAFTTKTAIYVLVRGFPGTEILIWLGAIMALYGVVYAVLENDCRRLLAYHIVSQVGYMVAGVGMGTELSLNGASAHAFAHILYKGLLFMGAGAVIHMTGKRKLTELGGLYKTMPITMLLYMVGALSISAFPFFSGFVSKSMVIAAAGEDHLPIIYMMLLMASAGTFLHTGLKLPYYMFFGKDSGIRTSEPPTNMLLAMGMAAAMCIGIGVFPGGFFTLLPFPVDFAPYTAAHISGTMNILLFTLLGFVLLLKQLDPENTISVDTDWWYRKTAKGFMWTARRPVAAYEGVVANLVNSTVLPLLHGFARAGAWIDRNLIDAVVNGVARFCMNSGALLRRLQTGVLSHYALGMVIGIVGAAAVLAVAAQ